MGIIKWLMQKLLKLVGEAERERRDQTLVPSAKEKVNLDLQNSIGFVNADTHSLA